MSLPIGSLVTLKESSIWYNQCLVNGVKQTGIVVESSLYHDSFDIAVDWSHLKLEELEELEKQSSSGIRLYNTTEDIEIIEIKKLTKKEENELFNKIRNL